MNESSDASSVWKLVAVTTLMETYDFTLDEMRENIHGRITERQLTRFLEEKPKYLRSAFLGLIFPSAFLVFIIPCYGYFVFLSPFDPLTLIMPLMGIFSLVGLWWNHIDLIRRWKADAREPRVKRVVGQFQHRYSRRRSDYFLVGDKKMVGWTPHLDAFDNQHFYCLYYLSESHFILSARPLDPSDLN